MTSWRFFIHGCFSSLSILQASQHCLLGISYALHDNCCQILDVNTLISILFYCQILAMVLTQEIKNLLVVYFKVGTSHQEFLPFLWSVNAPENVTNRFWNDSPLTLISIHFKRRSRSHHCVSLPTASLTICKHSPVVPFQHRLNQTESTLVINFVLIRVFSVNHIKCKASGHTALSRLEELNLVKSLINLDYSCAAYT